MDKTPASRQLVNLSKALLDDANEECASLRALLAEATEMLSNCLPKGAHDLIAKIEKALSE